MDQENNLRPMSAPAADNSASNTGAEVGSRPSEPPPARPRRRWKRRLLLLLGPLAAIAAGGYFYLTGGRYVSTENAYVRADKVMISAEVSGLISEVDVRENQHVAKGDTLFRIDDRPYRLALTGAQATLTGIRDELNALKASYRQKQEELALAQSDRDFAETEFKRQSKLVQTRTVSLSKFDAARHSLQVARMQIKVKQQELAQIKAQLAGNPEIPLERYPRYLAAKAALDRADLDLKRTVVRAPFSGVASNTPQVGQQVVGNAVFASPVMSLIADTGAWIEANFKETELTHVKPGQAVDITVDTYPDHVWHGRVDSLSQATGAVFSVIPPQNATGNWVKVVQRIPVRIAVRNENAGPLLRAGMSATVEIDTRHSRSLPRFAQVALDWIGVTPAAAEPEPH